jgi:glycosyltransferase involved in cell wall biosynthesis
VLRVIVNCGWCENEIARCLTSLRMQTFAPWRAIVTVDRTGDATFRNAVLAAGGDSRITVVQNERPCYPMENILRASANAAPEDVIVIVDGDDWLATDRALAIIAETYAREDCWMTYGSWISNDAREPGLWPPYDDDTRDFRGAPWRATAVRTWKKWLFDLIDDDDLRDEDGRYFRRTEDMACMLPLLEMSTTRRAKHIGEALLLYNRLTRKPSGPELTDEGKRNGPYLRAKRPYAPLATRPGAQPAIQAIHEVAMNRV